MISQQKNNFHNTKNEVAQDFTSAAIGTQNNFYSSLIFKPLKIKDELKIRVFHNYINKVDLARTLFGLFIGSFFASTFFIYYLDFKPNIIEYIQVTLFIFVVLSLFITLLLFTMRYFPAMYLMLNEETVTQKIKGKEDVVLMYNEIRSLLKMKDLVGYSINIYPINELYPKISFNTECIHTANAVEQLVSDRIINE